MALTRSQLTDIINELMVKARNPRASEAEKKASMAEALAYYMELEGAGEGEELDFDNDRVNQNLERIYNSDALNVIQRQGRLNEFAASSPEALSSSLRSLDQEIGRYAEAGADSAKRARKIYEQMNSTWRIAGNSKEFDAAKEAIQTLSQKENPTQADNYIAANAVQKYVSKNLKEAKSAVGMTRMAASLAFLKQTMSKESFAAYCNNLNGLRGIKTVIGEDGTVGFDKNNPRCIEPDTIGTVSEVYNTFRERFHEYAAGSMKDKAISSRDIAMLTALRNLQAKSKNGENLVVEHEALCAELEKVQKDKRFINALKNRSREELIESAWGGSFDSLDSYNKPLTPEQQARADAERERIKREDYRNQFNWAKEAIEDKPEAQKDRNKKEFTPNKRPTLEAAEKAWDEELEFRRTHTSMHKISEELLPAFLALKDCNEITARIFREIDMDLQEENLDHFARLIALGEYEEKLHELNKSKPKAEKLRDIPVNIEEYNNRVAALKKDPAAIQIAEKFGASELTPDWVKGIIELAKDQTQYSEEDRKIFPVAYAAAKLSKSRREITAQLEEKKKLTFDYIMKEVWDDAPKKAEQNKPQEEAPKETATVNNAQDLYRELDAEMDDICDGKYSLKQLLRMTAKAVAVNELKGKGKDGDAEHFDAKAFESRSNALQNDSSLFTIAQSMSGPSMQEKMKQKFSSSKQKGKDFVDLVNNMYKELNAKKQKPASKKETKTEKAKRNEKTK